VPKLKTAVRIRLMRGRALRITARIAFFVCGLISLLIAALYMLQQGEDLPVQSEWVIFTIALALVGLCSLTAAVLPRSWIAKACRIDRDEEQLFAAPFKLLGVFAAISYLIAVVAYLAPHSWNLNTQLMLALCPMYLVKMAIDPSPVTIFFLLAPMNAALYGALGTTLGYALLRFRGRH
jgi:uncharacterized membrane protein